MRIPIDQDASIPLYRQVEDYLRDSILDGSLEPGARLPSSRATAEAHGISRITVENAYAGLEAEGLVERRVGSGTFVVFPSLFEGPSQSRDVEWPLWQQGLAEEAGAHDAGAGDKGDWDDPANSEQPPISFYGIGDSRRSPIEGFYKAIRDVIYRDDSAALGLGEAHGFGPLRTTVAHMLASQGIRVRADSVLITSGSQQALTLVCELLLNRGDVVIVEMPTYNLALELFRARGIRIVGCPVDESGMVVEDLEPIIQKHHPKLIYTIPNFHNPTGTCMTTTRRRRLVELAATYNIPIFEDDFVGELRYDGRAQPALKALDPGGVVIYSGTFSKLLLPGLRIGYVVATGPAFDALVRRKQVSDLRSCTLMQRAIEQHMTVGRYSGHIRRLVATYRKRRDVLLTAIERDIPGLSLVFRPAGGIFVWYRVPESMLASDLRRAAIHNGVTFPTGRRYFAFPDDGERFICLNFAVNTPQEIEAGVARIAGALR